MVGGEPPFDEELFALQGEPPKLGPRSQRSGKRLLVEGNGRLHRLRHRSHPAAAGKERLPRGIAVIEGEIDGGLLHRPVGLDDQTVTEGDVLLVVDPLDVRRRAPCHLLLQFAVAADGEVEQPLARSVSFPAPLPCPVGPGGGAHPVETAALDRRLGEGDVELGLSAGRAGAVDVAVFGERERKAASPFAGIGRLLGEIVGGEIAIPGAESPEGADPSGHELL